MEIYSTECCLQSVVILEPWISIVYVVNIVDKNFTL